jgi:rhodanese-related sulfurtransferase
VFFETATNNMKPIMSLAAVAAIAGLLVGCTVDGSKNAASTKVTHVNAAEAAQLVAGKKVVVLDVRTPAEFAGGHIAGAKLIDIGSPDFEQRLDQLDKSRTYLVHCRSGARSTRALSTFSKLGFKSVVHLDGGMNAWVKDGQAVQK